MGTARTPPVSAKGKGSPNPLVNNGASPGFIEAIKTVRTNVLFSSAEDGLNRTLMRSIWDVCPKPRTLRYDIFCASGTGVECANAWSATGRPHITARHPRRGDFSSDANCETISLPFNNWKEVIRCRVRS